MRQLSHALLTRRLFLFSTFSVAVVHSCGARSKLTSMPVSSILSTQVRGRNMRLMILPEIRKGVEMACRNIWGNGKVSWNGVNSFLISARRGRGGDGNIAFPNIRGTP